MAALYTQYTLVANIAAAAVVQRQLLMFAGIVVVSDSNLVLGHKIALNWARYWDIGA